MNSIRKFLKMAACVLPAAILLCACAGEEEPEKIRDLEFTVTPGEHIPEELKVKIEEQKDKAFCMTYEDGGWLYIVIGYGAQEGGGFCIQVNECYEASNAVYVDTNLMGPGTEDAKGGTSYPFIVLKMEDPGKPAVFQ